MSEYEPRLSPVYRSLNEEKTLAGAERGLVIVNVTAAASIVMVFESWAWVPVAFGIHAFLVWLHKQDPLMRKVYLRYNRQKDRYDPWPHSKDTLNSRPEGFDKGNLC